MATSFPSSLDSFTNPLSSDTLSSPSHAGQHTDLNDAVAALQSKVGADFSAVTTSLDYKIAQLEAASTGKILQVVSSYNDIQFATTSGSWVDANLAATITPTSASNNILVMVAAPFRLYRTTEVTQSRAQILRGATAISANHVLELDAYTAAAGRTVLGTSFAYTKLDTPATTSATTYKLQTYVVYTANSAQIRWHQGGSSITLMEIAP